MGDGSTCAVCRAERTDNMVRGKLGDHSVGDGRAKKPKHTKRAHAPTNKCVHGKLQTLCLKGCGGNSWCGHGFLKTVCLKGCGGNSWCGHGRLRSICEDCWKEGSGGGGLCLHGRTRGLCKEGCREQKSALLSAQDQAEQGKPNGLALVESVSAVRVFRC